MPEFAQKPNIHTLQVTVSPEAKDAFIDWQAKLNAVIAAFPGFISLEILSQPDAANTWCIVQRFNDAEKASAWHSSQACADLLTEIRNLSVNHEINEKISTDSSIQTGVTEVIVVQINPDKENAYREWMAKMHLEEAKFPGFRGVYVQSPNHVHGKNWITLLQFDSTENLDRWLASPERQEVMKESQSLITSVESHRIISPYAGWFSSIAKIGELPPLWKQTMLVLLVLFPIVMLELKYLSPWTSHLNLSLGMFIGNAISVSLVSWPMMPIAIWLLGWWLVPQGENKLKKNILGTLIVLGLYLLEILLLWKF